MESSRLFWVLMSCWLLEEAKIVGVKYQDNKDITKHKFIISNLLTTPIIPSLTGITRPRRTSSASVPASMRSSLLTTSSVRRPDRHKQSIHRLLPPGKPTEGHILCMRYISLAGQVVKRSGGRFGLRYRHPWARSLITTNIAFPFCQPSRQLLNKLYHQYNVSSMHLSPENAPWLQREFWKWPLTLNNMSIIHCFCTI